MVVGSKLLSYPYIGFSNKDESISWPSPTEKGKTIKISREDLDKLSANISNDTSSQKLKDITAFQNLKDRFYQMVSSTETYPVYKGQSESLENPSVDGKSTTYSIRINDRIPQLTRQYNEYNSGVRTVFTTGNPFSKTQKDTLERLRAADVRGVRLIELKRPLSGEIEYEKRLKRQRLLKLGPVNGYQPKIKLIFSNKEVKKFEAFLNTNDFNPKLLYREMIVDRPYSDENAFNEKNDFVDFNPHSLDKDLLNEVKISLGEIKDEYRKEMQKHKFECDQECNLWMEYFNGCRSRPTGVKYVLSERHLSIVGGKVEPRPIVLDTKLALTRKDLWKRWQDSARFAAMQYENTLKQAKWEEDILRKHQENNIVRTTLDTTQSFPFSPPPVSPDSIRSTISVESNEESETPDSTRSISSVESDEESNSPDSTRSITSVALPPSPSSDEEIETNELPKKRDKEDATCASDFSSYTEWGNDGDVTDRRAFYDEAFLNKHVNDYLISEDGNSEGITPKGITPYLIVRVDRLMWFLKKRYAKNKNVWNNIVAESEKVKQVQNLAIPDWFKEFAVTAGDSNKIMYDFRERDEEKNLDLDQPLPEGNVDERANELLGKYDMFVTDGTPKENAQQKKPYGAMFAYIDTSVNKTLKYGEDEKRGNENSLRIARIHSVKAENRGAVVLLLAYLRSECIMNYEYVMLSPESEREGLEQYYSQKWGMTWIRQSSEKIDEDPGDDYRKYWKAYEKKPKYKLLKWTKDVDKKLKKVESILNGLKTGRKKNLQNDVLWKLFPSLQKAFLENIRFLYVKEYDEFCQALFSKLETRLNNSEDLPKYLSSINLQYKDNGDFDISIDEGKLVDGNESDEERLASFKVVLLGLGGAAFAEPLLYTSFRKKEPRKTIQKEQFGTVEPFQNNVDAYQTLVEFKKKNNMSFNLPIEFVERVINFQPKNAVLEKKSVPMSSFTTNVRSMSSPLSPVSPANSIASSVNSFGSPMPAVTTKMAAASSPLSPVSPANSIASSVDSFGSPMPAVTTKMAAASSPLSPVSPANSIASSVDSFGSPTPAVTTKMAAASSPLSPVSPANSVASSMDSAISPRITSVESDNKKTKSNRITIEYESMSEDDIEEIEQAIRMYGGNDLERYDSASDISSAVDDMLKSSYGESSSDAESTMMQNSAYGASSSDAESVGSDVKMAAYDSSSDAMSDAKVDVTSDTESTSEIMNVRYDSSSDSDAPKRRTMYDSSSDALSEKEMDYHSDTGTDGTQSDSNVSYQSDDQSDSDFDTI